MPIYHALNLAWGEHCDCLPLNQYSSMEYSFTLLHNIYIFSCEQDRPIIHVFDGRGEDKEIAYLDKIHSSPITFMEVCIFVKLLKN